MAICVVSLGCSDSFGWQRHDWHCQNWQWKDRSFHLANAGAHHGPERAGAGRGTYCCDRLPYQRALSTGPRERKKGSFILGKGGRRWKIISGQKDYMYFLCSLNHELSVCCVFWVLITLKCLSVWFRSILNASASGKYMASTRWQYMEVAACGNKPKHYRKEPKLLSAPQ